MRVLRVGIAVQALDQGFGFLAIHAAALDQEIDRLLVGRDDAGEAADLGRHVGHGGALVHAQFFDGFARVFHHLGQRLAVAHVIEAENLQE